MLEKTTKSKPELAIYFAEAKEIAPTLASSGVGGRIK